MRKLHAAPQGRKKGRCAARSVRLAALFLATLSACAENPGAKAPAAEERETHIAIAGQALLKVDPRTISEDLFADIRPLIASVDLGFTNFEMAVNPDGNKCGLPDDYVTYTGQRRIPPAQRPGNAAAPHAVSGSIMEYLAGMNFGLMSLANNHTWDIGPCGVKATIEAADKYGVRHAGTGATLAEASAPVYADAAGLRVALVAATTTRDPRDLLIGSVNGVWIGNQEDWDRNIAAVRDAARNADFVIFYQHFQLFDEQFAGLRPGDVTPEGHAYVESVGDWQTSFARAVIDAGASIYLSHGYRGFDGVEIYKGHPLIRQFGGLAYPAMREIGAYDKEFAFWGLIGDLTISHGAVTRMEFTPLLIDEGQELVGKVDHEEFLRLRGFPKAAKGEDARKILDRFKTLSNDYGADVKIDGERAFITLGQRSEHSSEAKETQ